MQCIFARYDPMKHNIEQLGEHETKFSLPNYRAAVLSSWLSKRCQPDPSYSVGIISSIYFDTAELKFLREKINSDHLKSKVRLRWYSDHLTGVADPATFLEVKYKIGSARKKTRIKTDICAHDVLATSLNNPSLMNIPRAGLAHDVLFPAALHPVFQLNYLRHRFIDPLSGARLAVDSNIHISRVNNRMIQRYKPTPLPEAVFELKDSKNDLPEWLHQLTALGCRKNSFSKYSNCYAHATGTVF